MTRIEQIIDYFRSAGHTTEITIQKNIAIYNAKRSDKKTFAFYEASPNTIHFWTIVNVPRTKISGDMLRLINYLNRFTNVASLACVNLESGQLALRFSAVYLGEYSMPVFAEFINLFEEDIVMPPQSQDFFDLFLRKI